MPTRHVLVIGAGLAGSFAGLALASRGVRVTLLERHGHGHDRGSSHGGSRIFRHAYAEADYVQLATLAGEGWRALERDAGERLLWRAGGLDFERRGGGELARIEHALLKHHRPFERLSSRDVRTRFPAFAPPDEVEAIFQPDAAVVAADRALTAALRLAATRGAEVRFGTGVARLRAEDGGVAVTCEDGERLTADVAVVCAGPWLAEGGLAVGLPLRVEQQQVLYLTAPAGPEHAAEGMPVFIDRDTDTYGMGRLEHPSALKVSDHSGAPTIHLNQRPTGHDEERAECTRQRVARLLPRLGRRIRTESCLYTKTPDEDFVIGAHPNVPGAILAGGFSGHGFKFGPALGVMLADLACDGTSSSWSPRFAPDRFEAGPRATPGVARTLDS